MSCRVIIAGTRNFQDYRLLKEKISFYLSNTPGDIIIFSGGCAGADKLGERYAREHKIEVKKFPADWKRYGKGAGPLRNQQMANEATHCILFWDGISKGTKVMHELAKRAGLKIRVVNYSKSFINTL